MNFFRTPVWAAFLFAGFWTEFSFVLLREVLAKPGLYIYLKFFWLIGLVGVSHQRSVLHSKHMDSPTG